MVLVLVFGLVLVLVLGLLNLLCRIRPLVPHRGIVLRNKCDCLSWKRLPFIPFLCSVFVLRIFLCPLCEAIAKYSKHESLWIRVRVRVNGRNGDRMGW